MACREFGGRNPWCDKQTSRRPLQPSWAQLPPPVPTVRNDRTRRSRLPGALAASSQKRQPMDYFAQQLINGFVLGSIYGLIAIGYTMVYGIVGMINFAHG